MKSMSARDLSSYFSVSYFNGTYLTNPLLVQSDSILVGFIVDFKEGERVDDMHGNRALLLWA